MLVQVQHAPARPERDAQARRRFDVVQPVMEPREHAAVLAGAPRLAVARVRCMPPADPPMIWERLAVAPRSHA
jgi:hypothetical protein